MITNEIKLKSFPVCLILDYGFWVSGETNSHFSHSHLLFYWSIRVGPPQGAL